MELVIVLAALVGGQLLLGTAIFFVSKRLWSHLAAHHAAVWEELGRPGSSLGAGDTERIRRFVRAKEHRALGDPRVDRVVGILRAMNVAFFPLALAALVVAIALGMDAN
ncbi:MAG: hypothetical protein AAF430_03665 [Myxococcota bacterium]